MYDNFRAIPENTVIIEDSIVGRKGALDSKCHLITVQNRKDLDQSKIDRIKKILDKKESIISWHCENMNILIPMAGER